VRSREELESLGWRWELAEEQVHHGGGNDGLAGRCACAGKGGLPFIGSQLAREVCE
jgi:hypothetical protein